MELLRLAAKGFTHKEAARLMAVSPNTSGTYTKRSHEKLAVGSRREAVFEARRPGLRPPVFPGHAIVVAPVPQFPLPDIAARGELTIGSFCTPWDDEMMVQTTEASTRGRGVCGFRFRDDHVNLRGHDTKIPFANRLLSQNGTLDDSDGLSPYPRRSESVSGLIELAPCAGRAFFCIESGLSQLEVDFTAQTREPSAEPQVELEPQPAVFDQ